MKTKTKNSKNIITQNNPINVKKIEMFECPNCLKVYKKLDLATNCCLPQIQYNFDLKNVQWHKIQINESSDMDIIGGGDLYIDNKLCCSLKIFLSENEYVYISLNNNGLYSDKKLYNSVIKNFKNDKTNFENQLSDFRCELRISDFYLSKEDFQTLLKNNQVEYLN